MSNHTKHSKGLQILIDPIALSNDGKLYASADYCRFMPIVFDLTLPLDVQITECLQQANLSGCAHEAARYLHASKISFDGVVGFLQAICPSVDIQVCQSIAQQLGDCKNILDKFVIMEQFLINNVTHDTTDSLITKIHGGIPALKSSLLKTINHQEEADTFQPPEYHIYNQRQIAAVKAVCANIYNILDNNLEALDACQKDRRTVERMVNSLPSNLQKALMVVHPKIVATSALSLLNQPNGQVLLGRNTINIDRSLLKNPQQAVHVFQEELLHLLDDHLEFTNSPEWKCAADSEISRMDQRKLEFISKCIPGKRNAYENGSIYRKENSAHTELLVDYFHIKAAEERRIITETSGVPSKEALNARMQEIFPTIYPLCRQFESRIKQMGRGNDSSVLTSP